MAIARWLRRFFSTADVFRVAAPRFAAARVSQSAKAPLDEPRRFRDALPEAASFLPFPFPRLFEATSVERGCYNGRSQTASWLIGRIVGFSSADGDASKQL